MGNQVSKLTTRRYILAIGLSFFSSFSHATNLITAYQDAFKFDPVYLSVVQAALSNKEIYPQARAALLPNLNAFIEPQWARDQTRIPGFATLDNSHISRNYLVTLTQPVYNLANWSLFRGAQATVKQADAVIRGAQQSLIIRTAAAYFAVLQAQDERDVAVAQKKANYRQLDQARQRYNVGLDAITAVYDAQASYDAAVASVIIAENAIENAKESLRQITGRYYPSLQPLRHMNQWPKPNPSQVSAWVKAAERYNTAFQAAEYAALAAKENIIAAQAGHIPTVNIVGQYNRADNTIELNQRLVSKSVGLAIQVPIFEGGLVLSQVRQAKYLYQSALDNQEAARRQAVVGVYQAYNNVMASISVIHADKQGVISSDSSLKSNEAAYQVGTRTIIDVLLAQQASSNAARRLAVDQYQYMNSVLALKQAAGVLSTKDLIELNRWLEPGKQ